MSLYARVNNSGLSQSEHTGAWLLCLHLKKLDHISLDCDKGKEISANLFFRTNINLALRQ